MAKIQIKRGQSSAVQNLVLAEGELAIALDTGKLYIGTASGNVLLNPDGGTAETATKLATPRSFSITGDAEASPVNFDGTQNVALTLALAAISGLQAGTYTKVTVDAKGRVTAGNTLTISDMPDNIPTSKITGLGTAAAANTGTEQGNVPVIQSGGKLLASILPDLSGMYVPVDTTINGKPLSENVTLDAEDVGAIPATEKGQPNGVATLGSDGKVPSSQLPSFVDDVAEYPARSDFPETGQDGTIYVAEDTNLTYRWSGTAYVEISPSLALGETASTAYRGDRGKIAYDHSQTKNANPHQTTYDQVGAAPATHPNVVGNASTLGHVKPATEFSVGADGTLSLNIVDGGTF